MPRDCSPGRGVRRCLGGWGGRPAWQSHAGPPRSPPGRLPAVASWSNWRLRSAGGQWREPDGGADGRPRGPQRVGGGPAGPGAAEGRESAVLQRAPSRPPTMWFQSNCPKILLQHEPRAIHSPATNQQQSYRINRFHTRGAGQPGARTQAPRPRPPPPGPVFCGSENGQDKLGAPADAPPLSGTPTLLWRAEPEGPAPQVTARPGLRGLAKELGSRWGRSQASRGLPGPSESSVCSLHPEHRVLRPWHPETVVVGAFPSRGQLEALRGDNTSTFKATKAFG